MSNKKLNYKQGVVKIDFDYNIKKGQIVNIIYETEKQYLIQVGSTSNPKYINKKYLILQ
jgi:hypothetical protein